MGASNRAVAALLLVALSLLLSGCQTLPGSRAVRRLPGVAAITGPTPPVFVSNILGLVVPVSVAPSPDNQRLYVAEGDEDREVKIINLSDRTATGALNPPGSDPGKRKPLAIAVGPQGLVFVLDRLRLTVDMYGPDDRWLGTLPDPAQSLGPWEPLGLGVAPDGSVYVLNGAPEGPTLVQYASNGALSRVIQLQASPETAPLAFPSGLAIGQDGNLFISDSNNGRVVVMDQTGRLTQSYGGSIGPEQMAIPRGLVIDGRRRLYVTDSTNHVIKVWDISTNPATFLFDFASGGSADGELLYPNAVAVDSRGVLYVADSGNSRVSLWSY